MKLQYQTIIKYAAVIFLVLLFAGGGTVFADGSSWATYRITIQNLSESQPMSPAVGATHRKQIGMFEVGEAASPGLEDIAEDGNQERMFNRFNDLVSDMVTGVFGNPAGMPPLTPNGTTVGDFSDALTRTLEARPWDRFSMATMLICTNDGFTGLDRVKLPKRGAKMYRLNGYDAGTEDNTEMSTDIVDPCSTLGPVVLSGDPNGNVDDAVDTDPSMPIKHHPGIDGTVGDLFPAHDWENPVAKVTITRISDNARIFLARASGFGEVPPVDTDATGRAKFILNRDETKLHFRLNVHDIEGVTQAHIHYGLPNENGPVVAFLFGFADPPLGEVDGRLAKGILTADDIIGVFGDFTAFVEALRNGDLYLNVHTAANPAGEIRGQIGVLR